MAASAGHLAGFYHAQLMFRDSDGYPMGNLATPNSPVNGTAYHAYKLTGPVSCTAPSPTRELATFRGGMAILGQRALGTSDFGTFDMTLSAYDEVFEAYISGAANDIVNGGSANVLGAPNTMNTALPQFHLVLTAGWQDTSGTNRYMHWMYPNVQIYPALPSVTQDGGTNPNAIQYTVVPSLSTRTTLGYLFSATSVAVQESRDVVTRWRTDYPVSFTTYVDDASATTIAVGYRPATADHDGSNNMFTKAGVIAHDQVTGFSTTTGATTHTAGTAGAKWVISYTTNFVAI